MIHSYNGAFVPRSSPLGRPAKTGNDQKGHKDQLEKATIAARKTENGRPKPPASKPNT